MNNYEPSSNTNERPGGFPQPHDSQEFTRLHGLQGLTRIATRRVNWIIASVLICVLLAVVITAMTKPVYDATATIELNKSSGSSLDSGIGDMLSQQLSPGGDSLLTNQPD